MNICNNIAMVPHQLSPRLIFGWLVRAAEHVREVARPEMEKLVNAV